MHKFFTSSYDASIYLQQPNQNAGRDEILEVAKLYYGDTKDIHRALIKFDVSSISASIASGEVTGDWKVYLNLKSNKSEEIPLEYTIYANPISQSWSMGVGTKFDNISSDGVSWVYRNGIDKWVSYDTTGGTAIYTANTTGSANAEGGVWHLSGSASQSYNYDSDDVRMDVTNMITQWISGSVINNGMVIHHSLEAESDDLDYGVLKFFSKETKTIYEPKLELVWNDVSFSTGSLSAIPSENFKVVFSDLKSKYQKDSKIKIRVKGREKYPLKTFGGTFTYDVANYLPTTTYYQLEDYVTNEVVYPFGDYTKTSCDSVGNYFILDLNTLPASRVYRLKLKIVQSGITYIVDDNSTFEIIN